jgi:hypothetical protein
MNSRDVVVRIIQPAEQPKAQPIEHAPASVEKPKKNFLQLALNTLAIMAISALGLYFAFGLFNVGIDLREIMVLIGIPLTVGLVTTYAIV